jgi:catechol 2,3-dioxygenase-like lactoylglutathione lyase family enzyme
MQARFSYAIAFVADMDKSIAYYRDVLGLTLRFRLARSGVNSRPAT